MAPSGDLEQTPLLSPDSDVERSGYKSVQVVITTSTSDSSSSQPDSESIDPENEEYDEEGGVHLKSSMNVFGVISLLLIGVFIANADSSLIFATYGTISSEFGALGSASWLSTSYTLATCAVQPLLGKLSDVYGRKAVLLTSYVLFAIGSVVCGIGLEMWQVIAGRVIGGLGAAGMTVIVSILITDFVPMIQVASWRSYVNVVSTFGRSVGGPLGGFLADTIGWRWSFIGQGPVMLLAIALVAFKLPGNQTPPLSDNSYGQRPRPSKLQRIDFPGAFILASTIVALLGALSLGGQSLPWSHPIILILLSASLLLLVIFVLAEKKLAVEPIFPPSLLIKRSVATPYSIMMLQTAAQVGMMYAVPLYFRATQNSSNTSAGAHLFPAVFGNTVGGLLAGYIISRTGHYKILTILATVSSSITYVIMILRWKGQISWLESLEIVPGGFGSGIANSATFIALTSSVLKSEMAIVTGGMYLASATGMLLGIAGCSSVQLGTLRALLLQNVKGDGASKVIKDVISDVGSIAWLDDNVRRVVVECYVKSLEYSHMLSLGCSLLALLIALTIKEHSLQ